MAAGNGGESGRESAAAPRPRAVAINVAANANLPGFRGPLFPDGTFECVSIPERFASNAHAKRDPFDAAVLIAGGPASRLFERAVALSAPDAGATAGRIVTDLSADSGEGPWWRRVLRFDPPATAELRSVVAERSRH